MKREENRIRNAALRHEMYPRPRSRSPKAYLGCDTCKLKHVKSGCKISVSGGMHDRNKVKLTSADRDDKGIRNQKIKLTDLCDDDKKRIVELIEELSRLVAKNRLLKEKIEQMEKEKQEQQDYVLRQANVFLEEKNFYMNEINEYKSKLETIENEMKDRISQWENRGREKDTEVTYFAKALQKSLREKNELHEQMNRLKLSLRQSLESFQKLKAELNELQFQEKRIRQFTSISCQTDFKTKPSADRPKQSEEDTEEEYMSTGNQESVRESSFDFINDKLEHVCRMLKRKGSSVPSAHVQKGETDLSMLLKNDQLLQQNFKQKKSGNYSRKGEDKALQDENDENEYKMLKTFEQCSKTSMQAERILRSVGKPLSLIVNKLSETENTASNQKFKGSLRDIKCSNFLQNKVVQKNNIFKSSENPRCEEDQLLEELFYSEQSAHMGLDSRVKLNGNDSNKFDDRPFTW